MCLSLHRKLRADVTPSLNHSEISIVFATQDHIPALLKLAPKCPNLRMVVSMDDLSDETKKVLKAWGESVQIDVKEMFERERPSPSAIHEPR